MVSKGWWQEGKKKQENGSDRILPTTPGLQHLYLQTTVVTRKHTFAIMGDAKVGDGGWKKKRVADRLKTGVGNEWG